MSFIDLEIHADRMNQLQLDLQATDTEVRQALRSTLGKMGRWLRTQSARGLSRELDIKQKALRRRLKSFRVKTKGNKTEITVWYGLDPIDYMDLSPRQTNTGVSAGRRRVPGAFIAQARGANRKVFKRVGKERLPIEKQTVPIQDKANVWIEDELLGTAAFDKRFLTVFERELEWRTQKRK
ncbi:prophage LambdaW5, minor tail protein Z-like protein [Marinobacter adhaerens]|uniref:Phage tail protein n=2 Tax=Marinobacter adhaerens TaxID=1033846 RepID=A0ABX8IKR2_9GAMM|nr:prophage LambdaW5, minor tail protein Z-like protein [Marinobacter adhaerens]ADP96431.1 prophage LambdaW5, minor tail protein Z-like protein [Marinobacter adhaerens HP15]QWV14421.1 phage tail protein [Marinobacter adhaerens]